MHEIDFVKFKVQDHSLFILRLGQVHRLELKAGSKGYLLEFDPAFGSRKTGSATSAGKSHRKKLLRSGGRPLQETVFDTGDGLRRVHSPGGGLCRSDQGQLRPLFY